jgi:hypothetical protein
MPFESLPVELVEEIAEHLAADYRIGSLAALNVTCKWIRDVTTPILFRTVILVRRDPGTVEARSLTLQCVDGIPPEGCKHTR